jgi:hypothetical protein
MGRVFFPTYSLNRFGVRDTDQRATLGAIDGVMRFPAEPTPRAAMTPTGPMLGAVSNLVDFPGRVWPGPMPVWGGGPPVRRVVYDPAAPPPGPPGAWIKSGGGWMLAPGWIQNPDGSFSAIGDAYPMQPVLPPGSTGPISSSGGGGSAPTPPASSGGSVSSQVGPTPTVQLPTPPPASPLLVSSGGGTQTVSTPTVTAPAGGSLVDNLAGWLGRSTTLFNYTVPNALLAGVVILGFAWLSSSGSKKR